jgi:hypothetical protein
LHEIGADYLLDRWSAPFTSASIRTTGVPSKMTRPSLARRARRRAPSPAASAGCALEAGDRCITVETDDKAAASGPRLGEQGDVAGMQQIETAISAADLETAMTPALDLSNACGSFRLL